MEVKEMTLEDVEKQVGIWENVARNYTNNTLYRPLKEACAVIRALLQALRSW